MVYLTANLLVITQHNITVRESLVLSKQFVKVYNNEILVLKSAPSKLESLICITHGLEFHLDRITQ